MKSRNILFPVFLSLILLLSLVVLPVTAAAGSTDSITTTFGGGNSFLGNMFDVTVLASDPVRIDSFDVNLYPDGLEIPVSVYYREGTYVDHDMSSDGWTLLGTETVTAQGQGSATPLPVGGLWLAPGQTYGLYVTIHEAVRTVSMMFYSDGSSPGPDVYENEDLRLACGIGKGDPIFTGNTYSPRIWNGTIHYRVGPADLLTDPAELPYTGDDRSAALTEAFRQAVAEVAANVEVAAALSQGGSPLASVVDPGSYDVTLTYSLGGVSWQQTLPGGAVITKGAPRPPRPPRLSSPRPMTA